MPEKEITIEIKNPEIIILLIILSGVLFLNLQVTLNSPIVFGDEGFHTSMAQWISEEVEYPVWVPIYKSKLDKDGFARVPLWNILEASFLFVFGFHEATIKFLTPFIAFLTGLVIYLLVKEIYDRKTGFIASIISITAPSFATYSVLLYTDVLVTFYFSLSFLLFVLALKKESKKYWILSGIFGALAFLSKSSGFVIYVFIFLVFLYELVTKKKFYKLFKKYSILFFILLLIPSTFILRNLYYYKALCTIPYSNLVFDNSGCRIKKFEPKYRIEERTEEVGTEQNIFKMGLVNYLNFAYGINQIGSIYFPFVVFGFFAGLVILVSKRSEMDTFLILMMLIFIPILLYSVGRAEDTARYTLIWVPIIAIVCAKYFGEIYEFLRKYQKYLALVVFVFIIYFSYQNLIEKLNVMKQVKQFSPSFFEACDWIKENTDKDITISSLWGSRVRYNCQRNTIGLLHDLRLSKDIDYTLEVAEQHGITHIFIQKFSLSDQLLRERIPIDFAQFLEDNPEHFEKIYENGPPLQQCLQQGGCDGTMFYKIMY